MGQDELIEAAKKFASLFDDPQPGLASWNMMVERAYQRLRAAVEGEESRRVAPAPGTPRG